MKKDTSLQKLQILKEKCDPNKLYSVKRLSEILGLSIPNTRRYLRKLAYAGLLEVYRYGHFKYYRVISTSLRIPTVKVREEMKAGKLTKFGKRIVLKKDIQMRGGELDGE